MKDFFKELEWRGLLANYTPGVVEQLSKENTVGYIGFDPTADSLHVGSLIPIIMLKHFQNAGHIPFAVLGGATGMIGDPSGKTSERVLLDEKVLDYNRVCIEKQLRKWFPMENKKNILHIFNNYDWFQSVTFIDLLRNVGKMVTVNNMISKDSVKKRLEQEDGMSYTEFAYQIMQGYDFLHLYNQYNCKLQMGGSDQWGNMTTGIDMIRKSKSGDAYVITCPLITKSDGSKFGKTELGNIWLSAEKTSPYHFYQFWINASDEDAKKWIKYFTFLDKDTISFLEKTHNENPSLRVLQKRLAEEVTRFVHGEECLKEAVSTTEKIFCRSELSYDSITSLVGVNDVIFKVEGDMTNTPSLLVLLVNSNIFSSKGEVKKMIQNGGLNLNNNKVKDSAYIIKISDWFEGDEGSFILIHKGKKNIFRIKLLVNE